MTIAPSSAGRSPLVSGPPTQVAKGRSGLGGSEGPVPAGGTAPTGHPLAAGRGGWTSPGVGGPAGQWGAVQERCGSGLSASAMCRTCCDSASGWRVRGAGLEAEGADPGRRHYPSAGPDLPGMGPLSPGRCPVFHPVTVRSFKCRGSALWGRRRRLLPPFRASTAGAGRQRRGHLVRTFPPPRFVLRLHRFQLHRLVPAPCTSSRRADARVREVRRPCCRGGSAPAFPWPQPSLSAVVSQ